MKPKVPHNKEFDCSFGHRIPSQNKGANHPTDCIHAAVHPAATPPAAAQAAPPARSNRAQFRGPQLPPFFSFSAFSFVFILCRTQIVEICKSQQSVRATHENFQNWFEIRDFRFSFCIFRFRFSDKSGLILISPDSGLLRYASYMQPAGNC